MSGHSKWSKVKHQKASTDVIKAKAFTKASQAIAVAVREGGGITDPAGNFKLRLAIEKARDANMPKENIDRAIAKGKGEEGEVVESLIYEAYGPSGVALLIEANTENRQRTVSIVKNALDRHNGTLASPGSVLYQFKKTAVIVLDILNNKNQDAILEDALEGGASDVIFYDDGVEVFVETKDLELLRNHLASKGYSINNAEIVYRPTMPTAVEEALSDRVDQLVEALSQLDDVSQVFTNVASV